MLGALTDSKGNPVPQPLNPLGLAWLLVDVRGSLLHFRITPKDQKKMLRFDDDYEAIATVAHKLSAMTLNKFYLELQRKYEKLMLEQ